MAFFKTLDPSDIKTSTSYLNQLIDVLQESVSGSATRRSYQVFVTSSLNPTTAVTYAVTGGLFQTAYDQDYTLATANPVFDMTIGLYASSSTTTGSTGYSVDASGKLLFGENTMMMREKVANYKEFAQMLLGDAELQFSSPFTNPTTTDYIDEAIFLAFKRLFARDKIKPESFATKFYTTGVVARDAYGNPAAEPQYTNIDRTSTTGSTILSDVGAASAIEIAYGGQVGNIIDTSNTSQKVGLVFYDAGIVVLDAKKVISGSQFVSGVISAVTGTAASEVPASLSSQTILGRSGITNSNADAKFIPDFFVSGSIDDIVKHFASCRFSSGSDTAITFQNITNINSTLAFCRATADEFNFSTNPTFTDDTGRIKVIDLGEETTQRSFAFVTSIGLYNAAGDLLAVAKLSRPVEKNDERDLTFRVRLDF
jgi:hypothetical protein